MKKCVLALFTVFLVLALSGCGDDDSSGQIPMVYTAGYHQPSGPPAACYWVDGIVHQITNVESYAMDMVIKDDNIYITGYLKDGGEDRAFLWVNGTMTLLTNVESRGSALFVDSNTNVYVAGYWTTSSYRACYWKNGVATTLTNRWSKAFGIFVTNDTVYTAGCVDATGTGGIRARYWENTTGVEISGDNGSVANDILVHQGIVYVCGSKSPSAILWTDGVENAFLTGSSPGYAAQGLALAVADGTVYIGGAKVRETEDDSGFYYANGTVHYLTNTSQSVNDITVHNGVVYSGGTHLLARACYWANSHFHPLCEDYGSHVNAICIKNR